MATIVTKFGLSNIKNVDTLRLKVNCALIQAQLNLYWGWLLFTYINDFEVQWMYLVIILWSKEFKSYLIDFYSTWLDKTKDIWFYALEIIKYKRRIVIIILILINNIILKKSGDLISTVNGVNNSSISSL